MIGNKFVGRSDSPLSIAGHKEGTIENRPTDSSSTETQPLQHKLAAILYADVEGYSRLTGADEAGTHRMLSSYLDLFSETIKAHRGEVKHYAGDAVLADFSTVSDALNCAVAVQQAIQQKNATVQADKRIQFRIGINLGEVIVDRGEVYGNGVNVAARLETLAEPGGICISGAAHDAIGNKLPLHYDDVGEHQVKNIDKPVRAFRVNLTGAPTPTPKTNPTARAPKRSRLPYALAAVILAVATAIGLWQFAQKRQAPTTIASAQDPVLAMPTGPSIAVLPFTNMSGDPKEDYFSDGLTEDVITELARFKDLYVLARNTTYQYKGQAVEVPAIGKKLGVRYVLEGSVRKSVDQVRITAQLIDAQSGAHVWADRYDRNLKEIFAVQEEIARKIAATIGSSNGVLFQVQNESARGKPQDNLLAYDHVLRSMGVLGPWSSKDAYRQAREHLERAIELDPNYARARQEYAWVTLIGWIVRLDDSAAPLSTIEENATRAAQLDPSDARARRAAAFAHFFAKKIDAFEREAIAALELAPNDADILSSLGALYAFIGQWDRGVKLVTKAFELNPVSAGGWYHTTLFYDLYRKGRYQEALEIFKQSPLQTITESQQKYVAVYAELGNMEKAREHWQECLKIDPTYSAKAVRETFERWNFEPSFIQRYMQSFAKAGYVE